MYQSIADHPTRMLFRSSAGMALVAPLQMSRLLGMGD